MKNIKNIPKKVVKFKKAAIWFLLLANVTLAGVYAYAVNRTVFNVVATNKANQALATSNATVADLESKYISLANNIDLDFAYTHGYQDASAHQIYISKKGTNTALSFNAI